MFVNFDAIYENGVLKPISPLPLEEHQRVRGTLEPDDAQQSHWQPLIDCDDAALIEQAALDPNLEV
jgi:predicted DNA-binding antitoxin AbrB/MazE fold protein